MICRISAGEGEPPPRHVVGLRQGEQLDPHVLGPRHLQERWRAIAVEGEVGVGEVVDDHQAVLAGEGHHALEEGAVHAHGRGIVGEGQDEELGPGPRQLGRLLELGEEVDLRRHGDRAQVTVGDDHRVRVDRIGRVRHQHAVAGLEHGEGEVGQSLLGPDGGDGFGVGVQLDPVAVAVPPGDGHPEPRDAAGGRVAMVAGVLGGLDELGHDVLGRAQVGVAHPEVDDILAAGARLRLQIVDDREDIRRQALDAVKVVHVASSSRVFR